MLQPTLLSKAEHGLTAPSLPARRQPMPQCAARPRPDCRDMPFVIRRDGTWMYRGSLIRRKELVCLFASVLTRDEAGDYVLETPAERGRIEVEDAPFVAVELQWALCGHTQHLSFRLNIDQVVTACPEHPIRVVPDVDGSAIPYLQVRPGAGALPIEARICRAVYYELVALAVPHGVGGHEMLGVWSGPAFFPLGACPDGMA